MSKLATIIYDVLPMPTDICNIIASYTNCIEQVYCNGLYYKYDNILIKCTQYNTVAKINNILYKLEANSTHEVKIYKYNNIYINTISFDDDVFCVKYNGNLICEYVDRISIYDLQITGNKFSIKQIHTVESHSKLMYADYNYIVTRIATGRGICYLYIRDNQLQWLKRIDMLYTVRAVAIVDNVLSYKCNNQWFEIVFF